jgi:hypothetical protein
MPLNITHGRIQAIAQAIEDRSRRLRRIPQNGRKSLKDWQRRIQQFDNDG